VGLRRLFGSAGRPVNFTVMRLAKNRRRVAALSFVWPVLLCTAIVLIDLRYGIYPSDLWAVRGAPRALSVVLFGVSAFSVGCAVALLSPIPFPRVARSLLLLVCIAIAVVCLFFAQLVLFAWVFPMWYVFQFYREPAA
jgi:hypothetical protein